VRTPGEGSGGPSLLGAEDEASISFDLGAELLAQRAQELFAEMPFGSSSSVRSPRLGLGYPNPNPNPNPNANANQVRSPRTGRSAAPSPLARSAAPSPRF
jgi:hypothetical protein